MSVGGSAVVECEVANLAGRVQWTKDGLTMGKTLKGGRVAKWELKFQIENKKVGKLWESCFLV